MLLAEIVIRKTYIEDKIEELQNYINKLREFEGNTKANNYTVALTQLFKLQAKLQTHKLLLDRENIKHKIEIGSNSLTLAEAIRLIETTEDKIKALSNLIASDPIMDVFELMDQRDELMEEYFTLLTAIKQKDWSTEVD